MTTRLEDDLRAALAGAPAPGLTLDPDAVLREGRRAVRSHRLAGASVAVLAALTMAVGGLVVTHRDVDPRPATPSPSPTSTPTSAPTGPVPVTLRLGSETYEVDVDLSADEQSRQTVTVFRRDGVQRVGLFGWGTAPGQRPSFNPVEDGRSDTRVVIGAGATGYSAPRPYFYPGYRTTWRVEQVPVPGTGFTAYGIRFASPEDLRHLIGYDFTGPDGTALTNGAPDGDGGWVTLLDGDNALVWADPSRSHLYLHVSGVTTSVALHRDGLAHVGYATTTSPAHVHHVVYGLLPRGVTKVGQLRCTLAPKASARGDVVLRDFGPDRVGFVLELSSIDERAAQQLTSISWTTFDGRRGEQSFH